VGNASERYEVVNASERYEVVNASERYTSSGLQRSEALPTTLPYEVMDGQQRTLSL